MNRKPFWIMREAYSVEPAKIPAASPRSRCGGQHPIDGLDDLGLLAVRAWSVPEALAQVRGADEDRVQALDVHDPIEVFQGPARLDHGDGYDRLIRVLRVVLAAVEDRPVGTIAAVSGRWIAAGPDERFGLLAGVDHRADHRVAARVEYLHYEGGVVPRHPHDGYRVRGRDGLQHGDEAPVVYGRVLHVYGQAVQASVCHNLGGEGARDLQPAVHDRAVLAPDGPQTILPHRLSPLSDAWVYAP